jgi:uncharacterized damage-inducible protein DinB
METNLDQIDTFLSILRETLHRFRNLQQSLSEDALKAKPGKGEWSARDILAHLHSCQEVWGYSIHAMLILQEPTLAHIHPRAWTSRLGYRKLKFAELSSAFDTRRKILLREFETFADGDWSRSAIIKGRIHTVYSQTRRMALHEEGHWAQLQAFLDGPYSS